MKVLHVESGLGNQMLDYVEYLAVRMSNPADECYVETILSEMTECSKIISQWNGYELERIFPNVHPLNIKTKFSVEEWNKILKEVEESEFWKEHWNYPPYIAKALKQHGMPLKNCCESLDRYCLEDPSYKKNRRESIRYMITRFFRTIPGNYIKRTMKYILRKWIIRQTMKPEQLFVVSDEDMYLGHTLLFKYKGNNIERLDCLIRNAFQFPQFSDDRNIQFADMLKSVNSVAVHVRRGDLLTSNFECYQFGFFKRAIKFLKTRVSDPVFVFFCDTASITWCKENKHIFNLDLKKDKVYYVDWNVGEESFRDIQLMSLCKHNIITTSTFGWWGAYLNENPQKITISPDWAINTTHTC